MVSMLPINDLNRAHSYPVMYNALFVERLGAQTLYSWAPEHLFQFFGGEWSVYIKIWEGTSSLSIENQSGLIMTAQSYLLHHTASSSLH